MYLHTNTCTGIRRYTNEHSRGFAFGLFYVVMNVAALFSGPAVDVLTIWYKGDVDVTNMDEVVEEQEEQQQSWASKEWSLTSYRAILLTGVLANVIACAVTLTVREIKVDDSSHLNTISGRNSNNHPASPLEEGPVGVSNFVPTRGSPLQILRETIQTKSFWRFLFVCLITVNIRMIFRHLDATLPKYMLREFGENVPKGTIYAINPALIIILVPLVTAATTAVDPLVMIHYGSYISAGSVFFLALSTSIPACILFVIVLSIGEAVWSPRLNDYTMSVVEEGREGTFMALSSAPLFLAQLPVGFMSGHLLEEYCPEEGERHSKTMWLIIGLTTAMSPILMTVFWGYISKRGDDDESAYMELQQTVVASGGAPAVFGFSSTDKDAAIKSCYDDVPTALEISELAEAGTSTSVTDGLGRRSRSTLS